MLLKFISIAFIILMPLTAGASEPSTSEEVFSSRPSAVERGDEAWALRHQGAQGARAASQPVATAVAAYEEALAADPSDLEATWKLLRAYHFKGDYTTADRDKKKEIFGRGGEVAEAAMNLMARRVGGRKAFDEMPPAELAGKFPEPEVPLVFHWATANWGLWGEAFGKVAAARQGVAGKIRRYTAVVIAMAPQIEDGGGYRFLGRLHSEAPKIPLITGWIDREQALDLLGKAVEINPNDPYNRLYLADAQRRFDKEAKAEAMAELKTLSSLEPRSPKKVEDLWVRDEARRILDAE